MVVGEAGFPNSRKIHIPHYALDDKGFISGMLGERVEGKKCSAYAIFKLFGKNGYFSL